MKHSFLSKQGIRVVFIGIVLIQMCGMCYYLLFALGKHKQKDSASTQSQTSSHQIEIYKATRDVNKYLAVGVGSSIGDKIKNVSKIVKKSTKTQHNVIPVEKNGNIQHGTTPQDDKNVKPKQFKKFKKYVTKHVILGEDKKEYFQTFGSKRCFKEGTKNYNTKDNVCNCFPKWFGPQCSIPDSVYHSSSQPETLHVRKTPRRIIHAFPFNHEFQALTTIFHEVGDVVDKFIIVESNYSAYGDPKKLRLLKALNSGYGQEYHSKILYTFLDHFPEGGRRDGWIADGYIRSYCGKKGLKHIGDLRPDDIILITDADEIISRDVLLFLKWHNGFPEPFGLMFRWSVYGYYWKMSDVSRIVVGCTMFIFKYVFQYDTSALRKAVDGTYLLDKPSLKWLSGNVSTEPWFIGMYNHLSGWHCSWCFKPKGIAIKLTSAQNGDYPRWGDYPEKQNLTYIADLIKYGKWFDGSILGEGSVTYETPDTDSFFAPSYVLKNHDAFKYLITNPYRKIQPGYN